MSKPEAPSVTSNPVTGPGPAPAATVWLVSFADQDDRELTPPEIAEALRRGQIDASTIVWREGLGDWAPLGTVEELAPLLAASGETSGVPKVGSAEPAERIDAQPKNPVPADGETQPWKGKTRIGLPKANPAGKKPKAAPNVLSGSADGELKPEARATPIAASVAAEPEQKKIAFKKVQPKTAEAKSATPKPAESTPTIPLVTPTALSAGTPTVPLVTSKPAREAPVDKTKPKALQRDIWSTEDEAPISVELEPESVSPRSPGFSQVTTRAPGEPRKPAPKPPTPNRRPKPPPARSAESGGLSLQALAAPMASEPERVGDDIMNLGGGLTGLGGSLLAAPSIDVSALTSEPTGAEDAFELPLLELPDVPADMLIEGTPTVPNSGVRPARKSPGPAAPKPGEKAKKRSSLPLVLGLVAAAIALAFVLRGKDKEDSASRTGTSAATAEIAPNAESAAAEAHPAAVPVEPPPVASAAPEAPAATASAPVTTEATKAAHSTSGAAASSPTTTVAAPHGEREGARASKPGAPKEESAAEAAKPAALATPPPEQEVAVGGEFDKGAAIAALHEAAAQASACRKPGDPSGVADVHVTFANSGRAMNATLDGPPFAGTATGGCIAAALRRTKVPPFSGDRVTVTKHVIIN